VFITRRTAASRASAPGPQTDSRLGAYGAGVLGAPTRTTGASRFQKPASTARAAISAPTPKSTTASCAITIRFVLANDVSTVSQSSGAIVRRSITSASMPSAASRSATTRLSCAMRENDTIVTSVPVRVTAALPIGTMWSSAKPGPVRSYSSRCSMTTTGPS
jgi:hypothetical protein